MIICHNFLVKFLIFFTLILNLHSVCCKSVGDVPNPSYTMTNFDFSKFLDITSYLEVPLSPECKYLIENFSTELTNYIHCTITILDSFHVCSSCLSHFRNLEKTYKNLTKEIEKCPSGFSSSKKYSLIQSYYANYEELWETNHCDSKTKLIFSFIIFLKLLFCFSLQNVLRKRQTMMLLVKMSCTFSLWLTILRIALT